MTPIEQSNKKIKDTRYIKVIWTCDRADKCLNVDDPGRHETRAEAGVCYYWDDIQKAAPIIQEEMTLRTQLKRSLSDKAKL